MKRIVTVQDISCVGKCSLTVALPILSAMGVETAVLPTAVLSAHTRFHDVTFHDLTDQIEPITAHWKREGITFDGIYTGYLGSCAQADQVLSFVEDFRTDSDLVIVDPVLGDHGRLYTGIDEAMREKMAQLCARADVILPNITEACCLTGIPYREDCDVEYLDTLLDALQQICKGVCIITGVSLAPEQTGIMGKQGSVRFFHSHEKLPASYHGTGDIFAATFSGAMLLGRPWQQAVELAAKYTSACIFRTMQQTRDDKFGVCFEQALPELIAALKGD